MTASRTQAFIYFLLALLIAMLIAFVEGGGVARADTPTAHSDARSDAASAVQNDWEQDSSSHDRTDAAGHGDASDSEDVRNHEDDDDAEAQDRRSVEKYFDWDKDWRRSFNRRHLRSDRRTPSDDIVNFAHDSHLPAGNHADSVVSIFGSVSSEGDAGDLVAILGNTTASGHVKDSAVAVMGNVRIDGPVDGDVVAVFGNVDLGPHARVGGDVTAVGGGVTRDPAATVGGGVQSVGGFTSGFDHFRPWVDHCLFYGRPLANDRRIKRVEAYADPVHHVTENDAEQRDQHLRSVPRIWPQRAEQRKRRDEQGRQHGGSSTDAVAPWSSKAALLTRTDFVARHSEHRDGDRSDQCW